MQHTILVFSGQASQFIGMGKDLAAEFREFDLTLEEASDQLGFNMKSLMFEDSAAKLNLTEFTQPAVLTMSTGITRVLRERAGIVPQIVAGHGLGEYSALVALGALSFADAVRAVRYRGQVMQKAVPVGVGAMAAYIGAQAEAVAKLCNQLTASDAVVEPVNYNSPNQLVVSGHKAGVEKLVAAVAEQKLGKARMLAVSAPFHSSLMEPAAVAMADYLSRIDIMPLTGTIVANVDAAFYSQKEYTRDVLVKQVAGAVLWTQTCAKLNEHYPNARWIEVGPGAVLQGLVKQCVAGAEVCGTGTLETLRPLLGR